MKQSLQFRLGQQLTMTPQLQQAIRLLQLSTLELNEEIQQALESNLMLEVDENTEGKQQSDTDTQTEPVTEAAAQELNTQADSIPDDLPVDVEWSSIYDVPVARAETASEDQERDIGTTAATQGLKEHLLWQTCLASFSDLEQAIAETLIESIDDDGYFRGEIEDIVHTLDSPDISAGIVENVLKTIQAFDPSGVGARSVQECLLLQLRQKPKDTPLLAKAVNLVSDHFELLAERNLLMLRHRTGLDKQSLTQVLTLIRSCNPRPGSEISAQDSHYVTPDIIVSRKNDRWIVEANSDNQPRVRINAYYANMIKRGSGEPGQQMMRDHLQEARWLLKGLQSRQDTLIRVAGSIVARQQAFLEHGPEKMKPLVMRELAEELDLHESTISRASTNKYMLTPQGVFEFKYFFSSHVGADAGDAHSSTAIRARIKKLIGDERPEKPLSDNKITALLKEEGISVARRTVAKYRESMAIPSSSERKQMI